MSVPQERQYVNEPPVKPGPNGSVRIVQDEPIAETLDALLAASYNAGQLDAAGADATVMSFEEWQANLEAWVYELV